MDVFLVLFRTTTRPSSAQVTSQVVSGTPTMFEGWGSVSLCPPGQRTLTLQGALLCCG